MSSPTLEEVARAWAGWVADDIMSAVREESLGVVDEERLEEIIVERLMVVAVSNSTEGQS
jgi:hypothetical protein